MRYYELEPEDVTYEDDLGVEYLLGESDWEAGDDYSSEDLEDESYDDEDLSERRRRGRGRRGGRRSVRGVRGRPMAGRPLNPYQGRGAINTPAGKAKVELPPDLVSKKEFKELEQKVLANNKAILTNGKAINDLNANAKKMDLELSRQTAKLTGIDKKIGSMQQAQMMAALIPPKLTEVKVTSGVTGATATTPVALGVNSSSFDATSALLPALLSGGLSGSGSSGGGDMMLPLALIAMNTGNSGSGGNDNSMLVLAMAMMMMGGPK